MSKIQVFIKDLGVSMLQGMLMAIVTYLVSFLTVNIIDYINPSLTSVDSIDEQSMLTTAIIRTVLLVLQIVFSIQVWVFSTVFFLYSKQIRNK